MLERELVERGAKVTAYQGLLVAQGTDPRSAMFSAHVDRHGLIATGPGAEERRSIAVLAVGGQMLSLLLTLLAIPVLYTFFDDIGRLAHRVIDLPRATSRNERSQDVSSSPTAALEESSS